MDHTESNDFEILDTQSLDIDEIIDSFSEKNKTRSGAKHHSHKSKHIDKKTAQQRSILSYLHDLVFGLVGLLLVLMLVFKVVIVSGPSMYQTLKNGDCLILLSNTFCGEPKQGDIIVAAKDSFKNGEPIIKRVIATEDQRVNIDFVNGIVYVDDKPLDEPYAYTPTNLFEGVTFPITVDEGCVFVLGDNRNDSKDSRSTEIGLIDCREILGKALIIAFPGVDPYSGEREFDRIGALW